MAAGRTYSLRIPPDLEAVLVTRAAAEGIGLAELIRNVVYTWAYGEMPSTDQGYAAAKTVAHKLAHDALDRAMELIPGRYEDVQPFLSDSNARQAAKRKMKRGDG